MGGELGDFQTVVHKKRDGIIAALRKWGHVLSGMIMPNLSIFIAWGLLSIVAQYTQGTMHQVFMELDTAMIRFLLPILIGYTGGKMFGKSRGGVVGAMGTLGVIVSSTVPQVLGAMMIGPLAGWVLMYCEKALLKRTKSGFEMLTRNFLAGIIGGVFCWLGAAAFGPLIEWISGYSYLLVSWLITHHLLPVVNVFLEPLKVFFFNNAINHGLLTPLGLQAVQQTGSSPLFLVEVNPGPGLGVLLAFVCFGSKGDKTSASGALMIHLIGGIHEIYFPFVLMDPLFFLAVIAGGVCGTSVFQLLNVGLSGPASPGSIVAIATNAASGDLFGIALGILLSTISSFVIASIILKRKGLLVTPRQKEGNRLLAENMTKIVFACDAGVGSSAMGASLLRRKLRDAGMDIEVTYTSVYQLQDTASQIVVTQKELQPIVQQRAPHAQQLIITNFLAMKEYEELIHQLQEQPPQRGTAVSANHDKRPLEIVFLYADNVRGSQTMGACTLQHLADTAGKQIVIRKEAIESASYEEATVYIATEELTQRFQLQQQVPKLLVVAHLINTPCYKELMKEGTDDVSFGQRSHSADRAKQ